MGQSIAKKQKKPENELTPKRWFSDSFLTFLTGCLSFATFLLSATACYSGNLRHLAPYDLNADFCGSKAVGEERQYLYYPDPHNPTNAICVESCPTAETGGTLSIPDGMGGITVHPVTPSQLVSGQYCFQRRLKAREILTALHAKQLFLYSIVQDIFKSTEVLFSSIFLSILMAIVGMKALLNKKTGKNISLAFSFLPFLFSIFSVLLSLYHFFTPRILPPGAPLLLLSTLLAGMSFLTGALPVIFPKTYARSRAFMLVGVEALTAQCDLSTALVASCAAAASTAVWSLWLAAAVAAAGRPLPAALAVPPLSAHSHTLAAGAQTLAGDQTLALGFRDPALGFRQEGLGLGSGEQDFFLGLMTQFQNRKGQIAACLLLLITFILQVESSIIFIKFLTNRCVKKWFEKVPKNGQRSPCCDYLLPVCMEMRRDWGALGAATFFAPVCRVPALWMQMLAAECSLAPHTDTLATYLQRKFYYLNDCLLFNNQLLAFKLDETEGGYLEAALAGYIEITQGKVDDHYQGRRYYLQELLSPVFQIGFFSTLCIFITIVTWIFLELAPVFNNTGEKALDSIPTVVMFVLGISAVVLTIFQEAVNAAACAVVMYWSRAASDVLWCDAVNSDTLPAYESKHLRKFLDLLRKKCDRQILF